MDKQHSGGYGYQSTPLPIIAQSSQSPFQFYHTTSQLPVRSLIVCSMGHAGKGPDSCLACPERHKICLSCAFSCFSRDILACPLCNLEWSRSQLEVLQKALIAEGWITENYPVKRPKTEVVCAYGHVVGTSAVANNACVRDCVVLCKKHALECMARGVTCPVCNAAITYRSEYLDDTPSGA